MNILSAEHLTKTYGEKVLFDRISFSISSEERIGLIGVNGTGKSSLLKIISGLESADSGKLVHANRFRAQYLPQNPEFKENTTVMDYIFAGDAPLMATLREYEKALHSLEEEPTNTRKQEALFAVQQQMDDLHAWDAATQAKTILTRLGIQQFDKPINQLSGGQRKRVAIATTLIQPADLLILDEPTNHIDNETVQWLEEYLSKIQTALLLVTHDRYFLDRVTNRIFELERGQIYNYSGNYGVFLEKKAERMEQEAASEDKRQNLLRRELAWLKRGAKARSTKQKARVQRAEELRDQAVSVTTDTLEVQTVASRLGKQVLELEHISKQFDNKIVIDDLSYIVMPDDRLGIIGPNGSGKSTLLELLAGRIQPDSGAIVTGQTVKIAYYMQENIEMNEEQRVIQYIKDVAEVVRTKDGQTITAAQMLERFLFPSQQQWVPIAKLSGGEKRRLYLLRTLMSEPNVLLLDEPTNDLDIQTLSILEEYLEHFPGAVIVVSHDRYFLDRTINHLFAFTGNGVIQRYHGNYSEYLAQLAIQESTMPKKESKSKDAQAVDHKEKKPRKLSYKEQLEWDGIEERIAALEEKAELLKEQTIQAGSDSTKVQALYHEQIEVAEQLEQAMERWTELSLRVEEMELNKM